MLEVAGAAGQRAGSREPTGVLKLSVVSGAAGAAGQRAGSRESSVRVEVVCGVRSCWGGWAESRQ